MVLMKKLGRRGSRWGHVTYFCNFQTPFISREQLELETSNFACRLIIGGANERNVKLGQGVKRSRHLLLNFGTPSISRERLEVETSNLARRFITKGTNETNAKLGVRPPISLWPNVAAKL